MKASEHFDLPLEAHQESVYQSDGTDETVAEFNTPEQAIIAARCINHADALADALEVLVVECENYAANFKSEYYEALDAITTYRGAK